MVQHGGESKEGTHEQRQMVQVHIKHGQCRASVTHSVGTAGRQPDHESECVNKWSRGLRFCRDTNTNLRTEKDHSMCPDMIYFLLPVFN